MFAKLSAIASSLINTTFMAQWKLLVGVIFQIFPKNFYLMLLKSNFLVGLFFKSKFELNLTLTHTILVYRFENPWLKKKLGHSISVSLTTYKITFHLKGT